MIRPIAAAVAALFATCASGGVLVVKKAGDVSPTARSVLFVPNATPANSPKLTLATAVDDAYAMSMCAWFKIDAGAAPPNAVIQRVIVAVGNNQVSPSDESGKDQVYLEWGGDGHNKFCAVARTGSNSRNCMSIVSDVIGEWNPAIPGVLNPGTWYHGCGTFANGTTRIPYLNGTAGNNTDVSARTLAVVPNITTIGIRPATAASYQNPWYGKLAHVAVWNGVLSAGEIATLAAGGNPLDVATTATLTSYWPFDAANILNDVAGVNDLTSAGSPSPAASVDLPTVDEPAP